ncbi:MAG: glycosyltransferase family 29 protein [Rhodobacteraceae bacterium]|nr:glycosyltransferase family 29 protein [Paracoccaceae bacterium]
MRQLGFLLRVAIRGEAALAPYSALQADVLAELDGRSVAIVGNARRLAASGYGAEIDNHAIVVRMHKAPMPDAGSHGSKTDWLALGMPVKETVLEDRAPTRVLWMTRARKRLRWRIAARPGFYRHPVADWHALADRLGSAPSTGILVIDLAVRSGAARIDLYGFDFFASLSESGRRTADQVPHDWAAERAVVEALIATDPRVVLHPVPA